MDIEQLDVLEEKINQAVKLIEPRCPHLGIG